MAHAMHVGSVVEMPETKTAERAVCELCGHVITTTNGARRSGFGFVPFEKLLDLHMEQHHGNLCVLPPRANQKQAA